MFWTRKKSEKRQLSKRARRRLEQEKREGMRIEYRTSLERIGLFLSRTTTKEKQIAILDYAIKVIKWDLIGESLSQLVYGKETPGWRNVFPPPPPTGEGKRNQIELSSTDVLVTPGDIKKLSGAIFDLLHEPFDRCKSNYTANYYPEIDLVIIINGIHHTAVASIGNGGIIECYEYPLTPSFKRFSTDGAYWYNSEGAVWTDVIDFRFALLYTLAIKRYELNGGQPDTISS